MPSFSSFALQFSGFTAASLSATAAQLLIVEAGVTSVSGQATLSAGELGDLRAEGRTVIGYVNTSVTDHNRGYWQAGWVTPTGAEPDVGTVNPTAPSWLQNNLGTVDFDPNSPGPEAILVDYRDPAWRALVVAQAISMVQAGFHGVFLDDVARYFEAGYAGGSYDATLANSMMALVIEVATAVRAIDPAAVVVVNSGVYIGGDSAAGTASQLYADYRAAIDGVLIENQYASEANPAPPNVLSDALANFAGTDILALENAASGLDRLAFLAFAAANGLLPYISPDEGYGQFATAPQIDWKGFHFLAGSALAPNVLFGLGGDDILQGGAAADTVYGGAEHDQLLGFSGADELYGEDGNDTLAAGADNDRLYGGAGNDSLTGEAGEDLAYGGAESDRLFGGAGNDRLYGGAGVDTLAGAEGNDSLFADDGGGQQLGGAGNDHLVGGAGNDLQLGEVGNDQIFGAAGADTLNGGDGLDTLRGDGGHDLIYGGANDDLLLGLAENDQLRGGLGGDRQYGGLGQDSLYGDDGNDSLLGDAGNDFLFGGLGDDTLLGGAGLNRLYGDAGRDVLQGGTENDQLYGGDGLDRLLGGGGTDILNGGAENDILSGGIGGGDIFVFAGNAGTDTITDFDNIGDRIDLRAYATTTTELQSAIRDWNGGVTIDLAGLGGFGQIRVLDHDGQIIALTLGDFLL